MRELDQRLLADARVVMDTSNTHLVLDMMNAYEEAVNLFNQGAPRHEIYQIENELRLRHYVRIRIDADIHRRARIAIERATQAQSRAHRYLKQRNPSDS